MNKFFVRNPSLKARLTTPLRHDLDTLNTVHHSRYNTLKRQFRRVGTIIDETPSLSDRQIQSLVNLIQAEGQFDSSLKKIVPRPQGAQQVDPSAWWGASLARWAGFDSPSITPSQNLPHMDDTKFFNLLSSVVVTNPVYGDAAAAIKVEAVKALTQKLGRIVKDWTTILKDSLQQQTEGVISRQFIELQKFEEERAWDNLRSSLQKALSSGSETSRYAFIYIRNSRLIDYRTRLLIRNVKRETSRWGESKNGL